MAKPYNIIITNGVGNENIENGQYTVTADVNGYNNLSIDPNTLNVVEGTNEYEFSISADGTLTLHVTDTGTVEGTAIVGAKFIRCDEIGTTTYGSEITTDSTGQAVLPNLAYASDNSITIYYKQTQGDGTHLYDETVKSVTLDTITKTVEVINPLPALRTIKLKDANYEGLDIVSGSITLN